MIQMFIVVVPMFSWTCRCCIYKLIQRLSFKLDVMLTNIYNSYKFMMNPWSASIADLYTLNTLVIFLISLLPAILLLLISARREYVNLYSLAFLANFLIQLIVNTDISNALFVFSFRICALPSLISNRYCSLLYPQAYSIPLPAISGWHFGVSSSNIPSIPMICIIWVISVPKSSQDLNR